MTQSLKEAIWNQFGASIDMLENAIVMCPEEHWDTKTSFWHFAYHTIFFIDYYLSDPNGFAPPAPFTGSELEADPQTPDRVYTKKEVLTYLEFCRTKCHDTIFELTSESAEKRFINSTKDYSISEILIYNMRHVQHHAGQLNLLLRQSIDDAPSWVSRSKLPL